MLPSELAILKCAGHHTSTDEIAQGYTWTDATAQTVAGSKVPWADLLLPSITHSPVASLVGIATLQS